MVNTPTLSDTLLRLRKANMIPFKKINLGNAKEAIAPLLESGYIGLGDVVYQFEKELAEYVGAKEVVAFDSCTSAIFISLLWELKTTGRALVSIPSMTVPLVANAVMEVGIEFVFNRNTNWVGQAYSIVGSNVVDSAHELRRDQFKEYDDEIKLCFSFYPTKTIGSADGGAVATNDSEFANWARQIITYGRNQRQQYGNSWDYDVEMMGYKRHWTNLQAAIALEQLRRLDETSRYRRFIRDHYNTAFGLENTSEYLYRINVHNQAKFLDIMKSMSIECGVHFKPLHLMKPFKDIKFLEGHDPQLVEEAYKHTVSLPFYDTMTMQELDEVIAAVKESGQVMK
jgi:dTDP-4-amino-4,6-dideoxygalactose transaminase